MSKAVFVFFWLAFGNFDGWDTLSKLEVVNSYDEFLGEEIQLPVFSDELKEFEGKQISLEGYIIALEEGAGADYFALSRFPFNSCFFCGNAGPETVAEIYANQTVKYSDEKVRITGVLKLNADDPLHLFFIIKNAGVEKITSQSNGK